MKSWWIAGLACAAAASGCASSGGRAGDERPDIIRALLSADALLFNDFDSDRDFQVTMAEIEAGAPIAFAAADTNSDAGLSPIEFQNWSNVVLGGGMTPPYRLDFDRNVDNIISAEEFRAELVARAQDYDSDENGVVARSELVRNLNTARPAVDRPQRAPPGGLPPPR